MQDAVLSVGDTCVLYRFSRVPLFVTPWIIAHQAPLSMGFSGQEYWSGLPCLPPGNLPDPGIELTSLTSPSMAPSGKPHGTDAVHTRLILSWRLQFSEEEKQQRNDDLQYTVTGVKKSESRGQGE